MGHQTTIVELVEGGESGFWFKVGEKTNLGTVVSIERGREAGPSGWYPWFVVTMDDGRTIGVNSLHVAHIVESPTAAPKVKDMLDE